jgi:outer membrane protein TolC
MKKRTLLEQLGRPELEALAGKALTNQERARQASARIRQAKKDAGLQQVSIWVPKGSAGIDRIKRFADDLCEKHLASRTTDRPSKSNDLRGQNQEPETPENPPRKPDREQKV